MTTTTGHEPEPLDLYAYLDRIGLEARVTADLATLRAIIAKHAAAIPFENLDPFLGVPVDLDPAAVRHKLLDQRRGGYCFEQNQLLGDALRAIGFAVTDLAARVLWGHPEDAITPLSHRLLRIDLNGDTWLADVGFGGPTPTAPVQFVMDIEQPTPHEPFRLIHPGDRDWRLQTRKDGPWKTLYRFDLQPQYPVDYLARNYWLSTRPDSMFVVNLVAARAEPGRRLALRNRELSVQVTNGTPERRTLRGAAELKAVLEQQFGIQLPRHPALLQRLAALPD